MLRSILVLGSFLVAFGLSSCAVVAYPYGGLPNGNYMQSCQACHINQNGNLKCRCYTRKQYLVPTVYRFDGHCKFIENINGQLVCTRWHRRGF